MTRQVIEVLPTSNEIRLVRPYLNKPYKFKYILHNLLISLMCCFVQSATLTKLNPEQFEFLSEH